MSLIRVCDDCGQTQEMALGRRLLLDELGISSDGIRGVLIGLFRCLDCYEAVTGAGSLALAERRKLKGDKA